MRSLLLFALIWTGCSGYDDLPLLDLQSVEPAQVEAGTKLALRGHGFPLGHVPRITLQGEVFRPGRSPESFHLQLPGSVESESLIEIPIDAAFIDHIGGRATVDGALRVEFRSANDRRNVFANQSARLDFLPDTTTQLRAEALEGEAGGEDHTLGARAFGAELSREESGMPGVQVLAVSPGGPAAKQGVRAGDVLVSLDGVRLYHWRDFSPDPSRSESVVLARRAGLPGIHALRWRHPTTTRRVSALAIAVFGFLGLLLGWLSPAALCWKKPLGMRPRGWVTLSGWVAALGVPMVLVAQLQWIALWIVVLGLLAIWSAANRPVRTTLLSLGYMIAAAVVIMLISRNAGILGLVKGQGVDPMHWSIAQNPASFLAFFVYAHGLGAFTHRSDLPTTLLTAVGAVLGSALFLGGWAGAGLVVGVVVLAVKALLFIGIARILDLNREAGIAITTLSVGLAVAHSAFDGVVWSPEWGAMITGLVAALALGPALGSTGSAAVPTPA